MRKIAIEDLIQPSFLRRLLFLRLKCGRNQIGWGIELVLNQ